MDEEAVAQDIGTDAALDYQRNRRNWQAAKPIRRMERTRIPQRSETRCITVRPNGRSAGAMGRTAALPAASWLNCKTVPVVAKRQW